MFCSKCGAQLEDQARFCPACGSTVERPADTAPVQEQPISVTPKKKSRKKIIAITAIVTALALIVGVAAVFMGSQSKVYLQTSIKEYDADGNWFRTVEYEYNNQGSPTRITITKPNYVYEEQIVDNVIVRVPSSTNGQQITIYTYEYDDEGHCVYNDYSFKVYDADGNVDEKMTTERIDGGSKYEYDDDGRIEEVSVRTVNLDGELGDYFGETHYHYNEDGRLHEISGINRGSENEYLVADFRYDDEGRLIASSYRPLEGAKLYKYDYDKKGNLEKVTYLTSIRNQIIMDNQHITEVPDIFQGEFYVEQEAQFEYDSNGRLISREVFNDDGQVISSVKCQYSGKELSCVEFEDFTVQIVSGKKKAEKIAKDMGESDVLLVCDGRGNITKAIRGTGAYAEYEYKAVRLSKEMAQQHESTMYSIRQMDMFGETSKAIYGFGSSAGFVSYVAFPTTELYDIEVILKAKY